MVSVVGLFGALVFNAFALPASAAADATLEGPPIFSSAPGLPDGRVYEQVSPANKNGNEAGAVLEFDGANDTYGNQRYGFAVADGDSVLFEGNGPMGEDDEPDANYFVASKNKSAVGWTTRAIAPHSSKELGGPNLLADVDPSADLSHTMFAGLGTYATDMPSTCSSEQMYLGGSDPFAPATWLERPEIANPIASCPGPGAVAGGTPDFSTVYFTSSDTLLTADASRAPYAGSESGVKTAWGFYEYAEGVLREAGVLPDGSPDPFGAVPADSGHAKTLGGNQVSTQAAPGAPAGSRAFFVSPDPRAVGSCEAAEEGKGESSAQAAAACAPQLYVRENGTNTALVSRDMLLPGVGGLPAPAPDGALGTEEILSVEAVEKHDAYVFASSDGSQAFFQSEDQLTSAAPEGPPGNMSPKTYDFDLETGSLTYLPGVVGRIVATDTDGLSLTFVRPEVGTSPAELELWSAGPAGGSVTPVTQLPGTGSVTEARMSSDGSVLVFQTGSQLSGAFNGGGAQQIYRYDVPANTLGCVSCPPHGISPTGSAAMSSLQHDIEENGGAYTLRGAVDVRGISSDGSRVFFDTPDPLVPQDTNTGSTVRDTGGEDLPAGRDVYEWENGVVYLISSGRSPDNSYFLDNSENGNDVFFATSEGLVPGDTDGAYDVYDARVPQPGDNPPRAAVPCEGSVCQGPPNVPSPLTPPASVTFSGLGNPTPEVTPPPPPTKTTKQTVKCKRGFTKKNNKCTKNKKRKIKAKRASNDRRPK